MIESGLGYGRELVIPAALYDALQADIDHLRATAPEKVPLRYRRPPARLVSLGIYLLRGDA